MQDIISTVSVPYRGIMILNNQRMPTLELHQLKVSVPYRGIMILNPVFYNPVFMRAKKVFCGAKDF